MSRNVAIRVAGLGKQYSIRALQNQQESLRELLTSVMTMPFKRARTLLRGEQYTQQEDEKFWALRDVSFEVGHGEVVGIVGRNGSGKSTLLKILSRITHPTEGTVDMYGRVGALLEVGTGFHPELTGRENVYLSGAILGMRQREIASKFDEIIDFSEIERFIDTPVKRYSSGMYLRLAFSVAAHLQPEIMLVDEVLAVGDARFQRKCIDKMQDAADDGQTIVFITHNMMALRKLCDRAYLLSAGKVVAAGDSSEIADRYIADNADVYEDSGLAYQIDRTMLEQFRDEPYYIKDIELLNANGQQLTEISTGDPMRLRLHYVARETFKEPIFAVGFVTNLGLPVFRFNNYPLGGLHIEEVYGEGELELYIDSLPLTGGVYHLTVMWRDDSDRFARVKLEQVVVLTVQGRDVYGVNHIVESKWHGPIAVSGHHWEHHPHLKSEAIVRHEP